MLTLTEVERIKALAAQLVKLLRAQKNSSLPVNQLLTEYSKTFGYGLRLQDYDASSLPALLAKLCHVVKVNNSYPSRSYFPLFTVIVYLVKHKWNINVCVNAMNQYCKQSTVVIQSSYRVNFPSMLLRGFFYVSLCLCDALLNTTSVPASLMNQISSMSIHFSSLTKVVDGSEDREVQLINRKSLRLLTSQLLALLMSQEQQVTKGLKVEQLSQHYLTVHGAPLNPCEYGFLSLSELLKSLPYLVEVSSSVCQVKAASSAL